MTGAVLPGTGADIDSATHQADRRTATEQLPDGALGRVEVDRTTGELRQGAELQHESPDLGWIAHRIAGRPGPQVDVAERHSGRRAECWKQPVPQIGGQGEEARLVVHLIRGEQAAEQPDGDLEDLDRNILIEGEPLQDQTFRVPRFGMEAHEQHGIVGVHRGHQQRDAIPLVWLPAQRVEIVVAPGVALVTAPSVEEGAAYLVGRHGNRFDPIFRAVVARQECCHQRAASYPLSSQVAHRVANHTVCSPQSGSFWTWFSTVKPLLESSCSYSAVSRLAW